MVFVSLLDLPLWSVLAITGVVLFCRGIQNKYASGLSKVPGPSLAAYTDLWRLCLVWGRRPELTHVQLHKKYGDLVRIGPKTVLVSEWNSVKKIYGLNAGYIKVSTRRDRGFK